jgi:hypothetical protein
MKKIACIGWGSLLWKPGPVTLATPWRPGGPDLPLEFLRDSDDSDELALVISEDAAPMPTFHALMATGDIDEAREQLRQREKIARERPDWVGAVPAGIETRGSARVAAWLATQPFDAAIWTAVPPKFDNVNGRAPTAAQALALLSALEGDARAHAEQYVRRIPAAIMTAYRKRFEEQLGWTAIATK